MKNSFRTNNQMASKYNYTRPKTTRSLICDNKVVFDLDKERNLTSTKYNHVIC